MNRFTTKQICYYIDHYCYNGKFILDGMQMYKSTSIQKTNRADRVRPNSLTIVHLVCFISLLYIVLLQDIIKHYKTQDIIKYYFCGSSFQRTVILIQERVSFIFTIFIAINSLYYIKPAQRRLTHLRNTKKIYDTSNKISTVLESDQDRELLGIPVSQTKMTIEFGNDISVLY